MQQSILFISPTQLKVALLHLVNCKLFYIWHRGGVMSGTMPPLFEEDFIASELASGVINKTISHYFKDYFKWLIEIPEKYGCIPVAMTEEEKETLEIVWTTYSDKNVFQLGDMIKKQEIWKDGEKLNKEKIGDYFKKNYCY